MKRKTQKIKTHFTHIVHIHFLIVFLAFSFICSGCQSTKGLENQTKFIEEVEINACDTVFEIFDTTFEDDFQEDEKFIFLRLYLPNYKNKLSGVNILKALIASSEPSDYDFSHSAIGFDLNDTFYGLTRYRPQDLKMESCTNPGTNKYMKKCDKYKSVQLTLALKVSKEEYENTKNFVERDFDQAKVKYDTPQNLPIGFWGYKRKRQKPETARNFGGIPSKKGFVDPSEEKKFKFVCSSYVAYVLASNVQEVRDFFIEKKVDYHYVIPTDLIFFPGVQSLFVSTWEDYEIAAGELVKSQPIFAEYFSP